MDIYACHVEGSIFNGRPVDYSNIRRRAGINASPSKTLSGGQLQRIALSVLRLPRTSAHDLIAN